MKNIIFYGNCQTGALKEIMNLSSAEFSIEIILCHVNQESFVEKLKLCDILITQPISDNYQEKEYLSTSYILANIKKTCQVFIFPSIHFEFYYPDLIYVHKNNKILEEPSHYHYKNMIDYILQSKSATKYIDKIVNNPNLISAETLESRAQNSLSELKTRESNMLKYSDIFQDIKFIPIADYIGNNYKNRLLMYSMNHPTKYILQYIAKQIEQCIMRQIGNINYDIDPLSNNVKCILYKCIQNVVDFDIFDHPPSLTNNRYLSLTVIYAIYEKAYSISANRILLCN